MLDPSNISVWKQLYRAAKAKQKLKLRVTLRDEDEDEDDKGPRPVTVEDEPEQESLDLAESKPEVPLVSPTSSDMAAPVAEAPKTTPWAPVLAALEDSRTWEERLEDAVNNLHLTRSPPSNECPIKQETPARNVTTSTVTVTPKAGNFAVCCNNCDHTIPDVHYHCSTCDDGDFDLCTECVDNGVSCYNSEHWMVKRFVRGDFILVSTTERVSPNKPKSAPQAVEPKPAPTPAVRLPSPPTTLPTFARAPMRTCNSCVQELPDKEFLHCTNCEDFDLCKACFVNDQHGHHPQHGFTPAIEGTQMPSEITRRLAPGRDQRHHAICDGCDKFIFGVRHKCLDCPDWDYCSACVANSGFIHPNHRFVPIYEQMADARARTTSRPCHYGICCDGPLCNGKRRSYIVGERYKCTVCHDTDFCAGCEASPANTHNRTHPLIKFKTPVRRVEVTTKGEDENGQSMPLMGDRLSRKPVNSRATETSVISSSPTTSLHTVVDLKPEPSKQIKKEVYTPERTSSSCSRSPPLKTPTTTPPKPSVSAENLVAVFERDTIADGTVMPPNQVFEQTWVLRNGGDMAWPAGCSVKFVGGDYMGHIDSSHPAGIHDLVSASESTVCYDSVAPGQEFPFTVLLRTPAREGKVISWWRLTTKDGNKFGHRLWCDVTVKAPTTSEEPEKHSEVAKQEPSVKKQPESEQLPESSQMIFPKLEKESPEASIHQDAPQPREVPQFEDYVECSDEDDWAEESDDGFLTDEEYDILDASDEEHLEDYRKKKEERK